MDEVLILETIVYVKMAHLALIGHMVVIYVVHLDVVKL
jgi:hypothetical protein